MDETTESEAVAEVPAVTEEAAQDATDIVEVQPARQSLLNFRNVAALLIVGCLVILAAMNQASEGPGWNPAAESLPVASAPTKSVLASTAVAPNQEILAPTEETTSQDNEIYVQPSAPVTAPTVRRVQSAPAPVAAAAAPQPAPPQPQSNTIPVITDPVPPKPPKEQAKPDHTPQHDNGIGQLINDLLSAIL